MNAARSLACAFVAVFTLAGCLNVPPPPMKSSFTSAYIFDGEYTWSPVVVSDDHGNITNAYPVTDPSAPRTFQQILPHGGAQPVSGVVANGSGGPPAIFTATWDEIRRSDDWGRTWKPSHNFLTPLYPTLQDRALSAGTDLWVDDSGAIFASFLYSDPPNRGIHPSMCIEVARSLDQGTTWEVFSHVHCWPIEYQFPVFPIVVGDLLHQRIVTGPSSAQGLPWPDALRDGIKNNVYICYVSNPETLGAGEACITSYNGGKAFEHRGILKNPLPCAVSQAGRPFVTPDGTLTIGVGAEYTPMSLGYEPARISEEGECPVPPLVYVSNDNGLTWTERKPADTKMVNVEIDPPVTYTPDGTGYYFVRAASDQQVYMFRSKDRFVTWEGPFRVSPSDLTLTTYLTVTSGDDGRLAIAYLGTRQEQDPGAWSVNASGNSHWHLFVTTTFDAGAEHPTFTTQQVTPAEDPIQVGCVFPSLGRSGSTLGACGNLQTFMSLTADADGRYIVSFTDGCNPRVGCTGDTDGGWWKKDRMASIAVLDHGEGLRAGKILPSIGLVPPELKPRVDELEPGG